MRKLVLFISFIFGMTGSLLHGQTTLISPTGDGGFENGATFAANGLTEVNYAATTNSNWYLTTSTLTNGSYTFTPVGTRAAYISNNNGTNWRYNTSPVASAVHLYRNITFPSGETVITLSFQWNASGESTWDIIYIYLCPTTLTPVTGSPSGSASTVTWTGTGAATLLGSYNLLPAGAGTTSTIYIPGSVAGNTTSSSTMLLVFTWKNDATLGTEPPGAIDYISLTSQVVNPLAGTKTIDPAGSGPNNFLTFTSAINALNINGVGSGGVTFNVASGNTFTEDPPVIIATGTAANPIVFQKSGISTNPVISATGGTGTYDAGIVISGGDYITFDGIDITAAASTLEHGFLVRNGSATDGAQYNTVKNSKITLNRTNTTSKGILQSASSSYGGGITPTATGGTNSYNKYYNNTIENSYSGIWLYGSSTYFDVGNEIGTTGTGATIIGAVTANDIGNGTSAVYGIYSYYQSGVQIFNTEIRNLTGTGTGTIYGINTYYNQGTPSIYNNNIHDITSTYTSTGATQYGMYIYYPTSVMTIYNNVLYNFSYALSTASATFYAYGIYVAGTATCNLYFNSIRMNLSANVTNTALYTSITTSNLANNILSNFSTAGATSKRYCYYASTSPASSSNNLFYIDGSGTNNFVGYGSAADRSSLQIFAASISPTAPVIGRESGSANSDPNFTSASNLTFAGSTPASLSGTTVSGITTDILGTARDATRPTIGAYETVQSQNDKSAPVFSNLSITNGISPTVSITLTDNSNSVNNATIRLWYRLQGSAGAYTGIDADGKPAGAMNGTYTWSTSLAALSQGIYQFYIAARDDQGAGNGIWVYPMWATTWAGWAATDPPNFTANPDASANSTTFVRMANLAGGTYEVGDDQPVLKKITTVASQLSSSILLGNVIFELNSTYDGTTGETLPIVFNQFSTSGGSWTATIRVKSGAGARTLSGSSATSLLSLDGISNLTIDGREGGTGSTKSLTIQNTNTTGYAVRFLNDASSNTLKYCDVKGASTTLGVIGLLASTGTTGNDNNVIDYCDIHESSGGNPLNGIYSLGQSATITNDNNTVSNCNIYNFFSAASASNGMNINSFNTGWTISGNRVYQTASRTYTTANTHNGIVITYGAGYTISGNVIGYATSSGTGTYTMLGTVATRYVGINVTAGTTTTVNSIQGNTVSAISLTTSSGTATGYGVLCGLNLAGGNANIGTTSPNIFGGSSGTGLLAAIPSTTQGIVVGINSSTTGTVVIQNNVFGGFSSTSATATVAGGVSGITISGTATSLTITGNTIGNSTANNMLAGILGTTTGSSIVSGIWLPSTPTTVTITNNTIQNLTSYGTSTGGYVRGIWTTSGTGSAAVFNITGNTISTLTTNSTLSTITNGQGAAVGINMGIGNNSVISGNTISAIGNVNTGTGGNYAAGIIIANGTNTMVKSNKIFNITNAGTSTTTTAPAVAAWIIIRSGTTAATIQNNMITLGNGQTTNTAFIGIQSNHGSTPDPKVNLYFNSINIEGTAASGAQPSFCYFRGDFSATARTVTVDIRNNIFVNNRSGGTGKHYAIANNYGATTSATGWASNASNFNDLLTANAATLGYWTTDQTFANWQIASSSDENSFSSNPQFIAPTAATPDLHIQPSPTLTPIESSGIAISSVTDDFDGQTRSALTPTDIGADAGIFTPQDIAPPVISYTPLNNTSSTSARTLTVTITDASGVPTSGPGMPVIYWKINAGAYSPVTGTYVSGSQYQFILGGGVVVGDIVSYYIAAQDQASTPNVTSKPFFGASGFTSSPPACTTPPTTPSSYTIIQSICGTKTVGVGGDYATLTAAIADLNSKDMTCAVVLSLIDASYSASETFPLTINQNPGANATNTLTIKPASGVSPTITGALASSPLIRIFNNYTTIDGSNTAGGTTRNLTISNTSTTSPRVVTIGSSGTTPITNCTLKNTTIINGINSSDAVNVSDGNTPGTAGYFNNITIQNNSIQLARIGVYCIADLVSGNGSGLLITGNDLTTSGANSIRLVPIYVQGVDGATVSNNTMGNMANTADASNISGIWFATGTVNSTISGNTISSISGTSGGPRGIAITSGDANSNLTITGNTISGISTSSTTIPYGIYYFSSTAGSTIQLNRISNISNSNSGGYSAIGIGLASSSTTANTTVVNNLIYDIAGYGYSSLTTDNGYGINISSGGGYNLYFNTISLATNQTIAGYPACLIIGSSVTTAGSLNIRNNIFSIEATTGTERYAVLCNAANTVFSNLNYNDYYSSGTNFGYINTTNYSTIGTWRTATGQDLNSLNANPSFISASDLHPKERALISGTSIGSVTTDYAGITRAATPTIGAYEMPLVTTSPATSITCDGAILNGSITAQNYTVGTSFDYGLTTAYGSTITATPSSVTGTSATPISATVSGLTAGATYHYRAVGTVSSSPIYGSDQTFTVYPTFVVGSISADQSICYNITPALLVGVAPTAGNTPYSYQWQSSTDNVTFADISGATSLNHQPGALTQTTYYRQKQTSSNSCGTLITNTVTVTVYADFAVGSISANQTICYNVIPSQLN